MPNFSSQVSDWVAKSKLLTEAVFHESAQRVSDEMTTPVASGGNMPVDTGFLWHSVQASKGEMPKVNPEAHGAKDGSYSLEAGAISAVINNAKLGDTVYIGVTAAYGPRINYGFTGTDSLGRHYSQTGRLFVEKAAQKWPSIVAQVEGELKARLG